MKLVDHKLWRHTIWETLSYTIGFIDISVRQRVQDFVKMPLKSIIDEQIISNLTETP